MNLLINEIGLHNCDKEPIHLINQIQPHGYLIVLSSDLEVINYSHNLPDIFPGKQVFNEQLDRLFTQKEFMNWVKSHKLDLPITFTVDTKPFAVTGFSDNGNFILEIEPLSDDTEDIHITTVVYRDFKQSLAHVNTVKEASLVLASFIQRILAYDRVMIYQFDEEWNGHVIGEAVNPGINSYFNHHFPSSDIPEQARALLKKLKTRQIADVEATPVGLKQATHNLNMEVSHLRYPSQIHLQFLENMKVKATLTFAIVNEGRLWGLVCAQHESAVFKDIFQRLLCQNLTDIFADALYYFRERQNEDILEIFKKKTDLFIQALIVEQSIPNAIEQQNVALSEIVHATGMSVFLDGELLTFGTTPSKKQIFNIIQKIPAALSVFHTRKLIDLLIEAEAYAGIASGLLFIGFSDSLKLLWFKPEVDLSKTWAGDPEKPYVFGEDGFKINPRISFESYQKNVIYTSDPWTATELASARYFIECFEKSFLKLLYSQLTTSKEDLEIKNKKLVELSAMMAHDIKNPLTSFNLLVELYESGDLKMDEKSLMKKLKDISQRILSTSHDLSNLSGILGSDIEKSKEISFSDVLETVKSKLEGQLLKASAELDIIFNIESILYPQAYLESILLNLISNAIKYRSSERKPVIKITTSEKEGHVCLSVEDNGKGINLAGKEKDIFGLYNTFHAHPEARGIGLYITKSQVESMGGRITIDSISGKGTVFHVYLQKKPTDA